VPFDFLWNKLRRSMMQYEVYLTDVVVGSILVLVLEGKIAVTSFPSGTSTRMQSQGFELGRIVGLLSNFEEYELLGVISKCIYIMYLR
jgi:hypothetical protein